MSKPSDHDSFYFKHFFQKNLISFLDLFHSLIQLEDLSISQSSWLRECLLRCFTKRGKEKHAVILSQLLIVHFVPGPTVYRPVIVVFSVQQLIITQFLLHIVHFALKFEIEIMSVFGSDRHNRPKMAPPCIKVLFLHKHLQKREGFLDIKITHMISQSFIKLFGVHIQEVSLQDLRVVKGILLTINVIGLVGEDVSVGSIVLLVVVIGEDVVVIIIVVGKYVVVLLVVIVVSPLIGKNVIAVVIIGEYVIGVVTVGENVIVWTLVVLVLVLTEDVG